MSTKTARILSNLFNLVVILAMFFGPLAQIRVQAFTDTNQEDYAPGSVVTVYGDNRNFEVGQGYQPGETVVVTVTQPVSPDPLTCEAVVQDDGLGSWSCQLQLSSDPAYAVGLYTYTTLGLTSGTTEKHSFTDANPAANLDQCGNGKAGNEPCLNDSTYANWVNGNLGESKSRYVEGDSIPYRLVFTNLTLGTHTVTFEWDTNKAGTHAIDYLTTWDRSVSGDPTSGVSGTFSGPSTSPIRNDPQVTDAGVTPIPGNFTIWNGTINSVSNYSYPNGTGFSGDKTAQISITFTASSSTAVLAWGGHISTRLDWGNAVSAVDIPGSPYHTALTDLDGKGGNQDRSLSTSAVIFPGSITVIKQATPEGSTSFPFTASPAPLANFSLVDDGTASNTQIFSNITNFTTYSVTEQTPAGWTFGGIVCSMTSPNGGSQTISGATATINLKEGENVTCTYTNTRNYDQDLTVTKTATASYGRLYKWLIDKSVGDTQIDIADGGTATFKYSVKVTPDGYTDSTWAVNGVITVTNPNGFDVTGVEVKDTIDNGGVCSVVGGTDVTVPANDKVELDYSCTYLAAPTASTGTNTATATWTAAALYSPHNSASGTAGVDFGKVTPTETNKTITVVDDKTDPLNPVALGTWNWADDEHTFTYSLVKAGVAGTCTDYTNTAVIKETKQSASQTVKVCVGSDLTVSKTASAALDRTYKWLIDKSVDNTTINIAESGTATFNYSVKVTPNGYTDSGWTLAGEITVTNPNDWEAITADVTDVYDGGGSCTVADGEDVLVPAGGSVTLDYSCAFTEKPTYAGENTATATWDKATYFTPSGTASGTAGVTLGLKGETNRTITVVDDQTDPLSPVTLGTWNWADDEHTFTYSLVKAGVAGTCTDYTNTAVIKETKQSASQTVKVCVGSDLTVSKTATPTFTRTWNWTITKGFDATYYLFAGDSVTHGYKVTVKPDPVDSLWMVVGSITISNPNDWEAVVANVSDAVNNGGTCVFSSAQVTVPVHGSVAVRYACAWGAAPTSYTGTNTATVTWNKTTYFTPGDTATGTQGFEFTNPKEVNPVVTVDDNNLTDEVWSADRASAEWTYTKDFACSSDLADYTEGKYSYSLTNIATINETRQTDTAKVDVTCTYPQLKINKTVNGLLFSGPELTFQLRQGASTTSQGTILETKYANLTNYGQVVFTTLLKPGTYQLVELIPVGYVPSYVWGTYGEEWFRPGYLPGQGGMDPVIWVAVNFVVNSDGSITFQPGQAQQVVPLGGIVNIDNQVGQMPFTIGYWKNHASAKESNGGQEPVLDRMLYKATQAGHTITIGTLALPGGITPDNAGTSATNAVRLLNKSTVLTNKKMASDPAWNLAAQLLGYRLNVVLGSWINPTAIEAAMIAQEMLYNVSFNGQTYTKPTKASLAKWTANMNYLASVLDAYNNSTLVITSLTMPYPGVGY